MRPFKKHLAARFLMFVALSASAPSALWAQENGFLVLPGIPNGPAGVLIDGSERGRLSASEFTLEIAPGVYRLSVIADGLPPFDRSITVHSGDVTYVPVVLARETAQVHLVHLNPARVDVRVSGQVVAVTPATVTVPAGQTVIGLGENSFCFEFGPDADAYVRVRSTWVDDVRGARSCVADQEVETYEAPHLLLSEGDFQRRRLWSRQRGGEPAEELWPLLSGSFSRDGRLVLATLRGGQLIIWDNQTGEEVRRFRTRDDVWSAAFSPDGEQVLARFYYDADEPALLDSHTGAVEYSFQLPDQVGPVAVGFGGESVLMGSPFGYVALFDASTGAERLRLPTLGRESQAGVQLHQQTSVALSPDGTRALAVIGDNSEIIIWDISTGAEVLRFTTNIDVEDAAFSPDGQLVLTATTAPRRSQDPAEVVVWDAETGAEIQHFPTSADATMVAFSPDGRFLLASSFSELVVWTLFSGG